MAQELYDVVVVGAAEPTPAGEARLAATLATSHGMPVASVMRGMAQKNLRIGEALGREQAIALVRKLGASGALTSIRKTEASLPEARPEVKQPRAPIPTPVGVNITDGHTLQGVGALGMPLPGPARSPAGPAPARLAPLGQTRTGSTGSFRAAGNTPAPVRTGNTGTFRAAGNTPAPVRTGNTGTFRAAAPAGRTGNTGNHRASGNTPAPVKTGNTGTFRAAAAAARAAAAVAPRTGNTGTFQAATPNSSPALRPLGAAAAEPVTPGPTPVAISLDDSGAISLSYDPPSANSSFGMAELPAPGGRDPFALPEQHDAPLELVTDSPSQSISRPAPITLAGASGLNTSKIINTDSSSGLRLSEQEAAGDNERCPSHGLLYDRRSSTGCKKCQEEKQGKRSAARGTARMHSSRSSLQDNPARRAFLGVSLALALGFLPAALYALQPAAGETGRLRAEQTELSQRAGTEDNLRRFDELDVQVDASRNKAIRNTLIIWVVVGGVVMGAYYKITG